MSVFGSNPLSDSSVMYAYDKFFHLIISSPSVTILFCVSYSYKRMAGKHALTMPILKQ